MGVVDEQVGFGHIRSVDYLDQAVGSPDHAELVLAPELDRLGVFEADQGIVAIDAEGSFLYLVVPVVPSNVDVETLLELLHDYKVVIVRGGGVWAVGMQSLSEVLHHPSSVREMSLYRIGAFERGLDLRALEPEKAKRW